MSEKVNSPLERRDSVHTHHIGGMAGTFYALLAGLRLG